MTYTHGACDKCGMDIAPGASVEVHAIPGSIMHFHCECAPSDEQADLRAECGRLRAQLPPEMQNCTIRFLECEKGHGRLTALNWIDHGCGICERDALRAEVAEYKADAEAWRESFKMRLDRSSEATEIANYVRGAIRDGDFDEPEDGVFWDIMCNRLGIAGSRAEVERLKGEADAREARITWLKTVEENQSARIAALETALRESRAVCVSFLSALDLIPFREGAEKRTADEIDRVIDLATRALEGT